MQYWEIYEPYYALIKAKDDFMATEEYIRFVAGDENEYGEILKNMEPVERDYALAMYSQAKSEDGDLIPVKEVLDDFRSNQTMTLLIDGSLL